MAFNFSASCSSRSGVNAMEPRLEPNRFSLLALVVAGGAISLVGCAATWAKLTIKSPSLFVASLVIGVSSRSVADLLSIADVDMLRAGVGIVSASRISDSDDERIGWDWEATWTFA